MKNQTIQLGTNGPTVSAIGTGLMSLGHAYGAAGDTPTRLRFLDALYAAGAHHWDTADAYFDCEEVIGEWFRLNPEKRGEIFLATKFSRDPSAPEGTIKIRSDPPYVGEALERSLKKLQTTYIDLYYCHRVDGVTPIELTVKAMADLKEQGKIRYLGLSEVTSGTLRRAQAVHPISALQIEYSPFTLEIESPQGPYAESVMDTCKELGIAIVAYSPLGRGLLTGSVTKAEDVGSDSRRLFPAFQEQNLANNLELVKRIQAVTEKKKEATGDASITQSQVVLAWVRKQWNMITPIPGTRNLDRMMENQGSANVELTEEEDKTIRAACDEIKRAGERYPAAFLASIAGETPEL